MSRLNTCYMYLCVPGLQSNGLVKEERGKRQNTNQYAFVAWIVDRHSDTETETIDEF